MTNALILKHIENVTHDTYKLTCTKPDGFSFSPGQATTLTVLKDGWRDEERPFTFTSQPEDGTLEFVIKSYPSHDGVTEQISQLVPGDTLEMGEAWGAIKDEGPGVFIAGGAGITPFIPILRHREKTGTLEGCTLLLAAKTERDLILRDEWDGMNNLNTRYVLSDEVVDKHDHGRIDLDLLNTYVAGQGEGTHRFYICGPDPMIDSVRENLLSLGVAKTRIITEDGH